MQAHYQIITKHDGRRDGEAIMQTLRNIHQENRASSLFLLNYYCCIPVSYTTHMESVDQDCIEVTVNSAQAVVLYQQRQTLLKSHLFPDSLSVHCMVEYINVRTCRALLGRFAYASIKADLREAVRTQVEQSINVVFELDNNTIRGELRDISHTGVGIESKEPLPPECTNDGILRFQLLCNLLVLPACHVNSIKISDGWFHSFHLHDDIHGNRIVDQFLYNRQVEIIHDLKDQAAVFEKSVY